MTEVEIIVYEVGVNLHEESKQEAQYRGHKAEVLPACRPQRERHANHHWHRCPGEGLGACGKQPRLP